MILNVPEPRKSSRRAKFLPGQLIRHRKYPYRGVVVGHDASCRASDAWYYANQTQPPRNQPWYHVLVHDSDAVTYAAESSLMADQIGGEVRHPLVDQYFDGFKNGRYLRNETPWSF